MQIIINGKTYSANPGEKILDVARRNRVEIPTLCHSEALPGLASCRLCMVKVHEGGKTQEVAACTYPVTNGIEVVTDSEMITAKRKILLALYNLIAPNSERIKQLMARYKVEPFDRFVTEDDSNCILCGLCVKACEELGTNAISTLFRGTKKKIGTAFEQPATECIGCGSCASVCPTQAIEMTEADGKRTVWNKTFELLRCQDCGEYFTTPEALAYVRQKLGDTVGNIEELQLCDYCKNKRAAEKLKNGLRLNELFYETVK